jgi:hypothetical protein
MPPRENASPTKRSADFIDLTGSDDEGPARRRIRSGTSSRAGSENRIAAIQRLQVNEGPARRRIRSGASSRAGSENRIAAIQHLQVMDETADSEDVLFLGASNSTDDPVEKYGTIKSKAVGCRYYEGIATIGEYVMLKR